MKKTSMSSSGLGAKIIAAAIVGGFYFLLTQSFFGVLILASMVYVGVLYMTRFVKAIGPNDRKYQHVGAGVMTIVMVVLGVNDGFAMLFAGLVAALVFSVLIAGDAAATIFSKHVEKVLAQSKQQKKPQAQP